MLAASSTSITVTVSPYSAPIASNCDLAATHDAHPSRVNKIKPCICESGFVAVTHR
ncbi:hypothetical protein GCM10007304_07100 [Rhodococcoides trifolii]|uniref:Uncharacterized protein n=1 Tax=Rhodococcoides trifolii TaxID=908250 RepID=A0A917CSG3_9NOCA|nr:hypothetical protein GCM10007304_07100 [Rhodococcus trifolii]